MEKNSLFKLMFVHLVFLACLIFIIAGSVFAQETDQVKEEIFREAREAFNRAAEESVPFFSPANFAKANEFYQKALSDFEMGERLRTIRENLNRAMEHLERAFEISRIALVTLEGLIHTRLEMIELVAAKLMAQPERPEYFIGKLLTERDFREDQSYGILKSEDKYKTAVLKIETGDLNTAGSLAQDAEKDYRASAIRYLTAEVLADAGRRLEESAGRLPANSVIQARSALAELEHFLEIKKRERFSIADLSAEIRFRVQDILAVTGAPSPQKEKPDLAVDELIVTPEHPKTGEEFSLRTLIRNMGNMTAEAIRVLFTGHEGREVGSGFIDFLEPGQVKETGIVLAVENPGNWLITVVIDPENNIEESDERNNESKIELDIEKRSDIPGRSAEPVINFSAGKELDFKTRGPRNPELPQGLQKKRKEWSEAFSMKYNEVVELNPGKKMDFPFEFENASLIFFKIYAYGSENQKPVVLAELYQGRQPVWIGESVQLNNSTGFISRQVKVPDETLAQKANWTLSLTSRTNEPVTTELWIGVATGLE